MSRDINIIIQKSINGDCGAKEELLLRLKPIIISSIRKYYNKYNLYDDLIQEGYEVILNALEDYNEEKGVHFLGFIKAQLRYHYLNKHKLERDVLSLNQPIGLHDGEIELMDTIADKGLGQEDILIKKFNIYMIRTSLHELTERQRQIIMLFYIEAKTIGQISKILGISYRTVVNTKTVAIKKMREKIIENYVRV